MEKNDLQKKLGLDLIQAQTANQAAAAYNAQHATDPGRVQLTGATGVGSSVSYNPGVVSQAPVTAQPSQATNINQQIREQNIAERRATTGVRPPTSVTNLNLGGIGIAPKRNTNIAQTASQVPTIKPPTSTLTPNGQGMMQADGTITPVDNVTGLQGAELQAYNMLSPAEQKMYNSLATQGIKAQTDYLQKAKAEREYAEQQNAINLEQQKNIDTLDDIQAKQQLETANKQLANLRQNIGYIGSGGQPGQSARKLDAVSNQLTLASRTYADMEEADRLNKSNRALGQQANAAQFARQMTLLQDDLDSKVNKRIQDAFNTASAAEMKGKLDTIPEIDAFRQELYAQLDGDLSSIMDTNIAARQFLIERYDKLAIEQKNAIADQQRADAEIQKNANTINENMSKALGYFVDGNGDPVIDAQTGQRIPMPPESKVIYDANSGQAVIQTTNRDGSTTFDVRQVSAGKDTVSTAKYQKIGTDAEGKDIYGFVDEKNRTVTPYGNQTMGTQANAPTAQEITSISSRLRGQNVQCGMVSNDYWKSKTGQSLGIGDTLESKVNAIEKVGVSPIPQVGSVFVMDVGTKAGHTGIVQSVDIQNGTFTAIDANRAGKSTGGPVEQGATYKISDKTAFSVPPEEKYTNDDYINRITSMLPAGMKDNKGEMDRITKLAKTYKAQGLSPGEAVLAFSGYSIDNPEDSDVAMEYVDIGDGLNEKKPKNYEATVSKYINRGDYKGLDTYVNSLVDDKVKARLGDSAILSSDYKVGTGRTNEIISLIEKNKDKLGAFDGYVSDFVQKFKNEPEYQKIKTMLQMSQAETRKFFAGSAVTETEMKALQDFIGGNTKMDPDNLITLLKTLDSDRKNTYDAQRAGMIPPDVNTIATQKKLGVKGGLGDLISGLNALINP